MDRRNGELDEKSQRPKAGKVIENLGDNDTLITTELSRFGRSLMEVMSILHDLMNKKVKVLTTKARYELGDNINSKVLVFAFEFSAEIERNMISQRTMEALARKKAGGITLSRPKGSLSKVTKLTGKEDTIKELLSKEVPVRSSAKILEVHGLTVANFIRSRKLIPQRDFLHECASKAYSSKQGHQMVVKPSILNPR
jgi:putative DNA-invertase from lambdoid prophage Rac